MVDRGFTMGGSSTLLHIFVNKSGGHNLFLCLDLSDRGCLVKRGFLCLSILYEKEFLILNNSCDGGGCHTN